jgi:hypothetical protein
MAGHAQSCVMVVCAENSMHNQQMEELVPLQPHVLGPTLQAMDRGDRVQHRLQTQPILLAHYPQCYP